MITFDHFTYTYPGATVPALRDVTLAIAPGEFVLVSGPSGAGKSTLLRCLNGLVPHFTGGRVSGRLIVAGHDPLTAGPQVLGETVGFVFQDPEAQFVVDTVEDEIAFALEHRALPPGEMRARVAEALHLLGLTPLRSRPPTTLSGGEKQKVALGVALVLRPQIIALDEPTSQLDPRSAREILTALKRLNRDLGLTIILAEHRLERVLPYADRLIYLPGGGRPVLSGPPRSILRESDLTPPLVTLGKALGWEPLPITVEEARRRLGHLPPPPAGREMYPCPRRGQATAPHLIVRDLRFAYNDRPILNGLSFTVGAGELVALMGANGSGKTTLLKCLVGLLRPQGGEISLAGETLVGQETAHICRRVGYLPQMPDDLLFADTVAGELWVTLRNHGLEAHPPVSPATLLARLGLETVSAAYPRDLSAGQRQRVALGAVTVTKPRLLLLDEPTRGMDYRAKEGLLRLLRSWQKEGAGILLATHDVELVARAADRVLLLAEGRIAATGPPGEILTRHPTLTPQMAQLFPGRGWLTVEEVLAQLRREKVG